MKRILGFLLSLLIIYAVYFDLTVGTLPHANSQTVTATAKPEVNFPFFEASVGPGQTLISIVEHHSNSSLSVPITALVHDFKALNPGQSPDKLQIGKSYRFPEYSR
ncbi:MAG: hypothetical protein Q8934_11435 [Bacillota bacterium]|nr:hypothetical protein [Bacillota bacterium]